MYTEPQCFDDNSFTKEYGVFDVDTLLRLLKTALLNCKTILNFIGEHPISLPHSCCARTASQ